MSVYLSIAGVLQFPLVGKPATFHIRLLEIARTIKKNGGVVSTEQLAPFLDGDRSDSGMILTALARFQGRPEVTQSGYIVYVFPEFLDPGFAPQLNRLTDMDYLKENEWKFSAFPVQAQVKVLVLAILNFAGSWWLFKHIATINLLHQLALLIDVLLTYAVVFLAIPAVRFLVLLVLNHRIRERNQRREAAYRLLHSSDMDLLKELAEARQVRQEEMARLSYDRTIIFSSDKDNLEQQFEQ
ncbi:MAG TPA: hypothetical protein V6D08_12090 [Candidatus Obscuribacterales bacterium]